MDLQVLAKATAERVGIPPSLFLGLVQTESAWNPSAKSPAGALGLAQVMPAMARAYGYQPSDMLDPAKGLDAGARILRDEISRFGSWELAAMAYNAGSPAVKRAISRARSTEPEKVSPYVPTETGKYWRKVITWGAMFAGAITPAEAKARVRSGELSQAATAWAKSSTGKASILMILSLVLAGLLVILRPR